MNQDDRGRQDGSRRPDSQVLGYVILREEMLHDMKRKNLQTSSSVEVRSNVKDSSWQRVKSYVVDFLRHCDL